MIDEPTAPAAKTVKIFSRWDGSLIGEFPGENIKEALENAARVGARLDGARLVGASLVRARLDGARLDGARLDGARLDGARLVGASLDGASLDGASLVGASLDGASLVGASLPSPGVVLLAYWGKLSDATTLALMRLDASAHPDPAAFDRWAAGGECPYEGCVVQRAAYFQESQRLWVPGAAPTLWKALVMVLDEKCPGWRKVSEESEA